MSKFVPNGYLIQDSNKPTTYVKTFQYFGINSYINFPLSSINNKICKKLTDLQSTKIDVDGYHQFLEFISNKNLYEDYINGCFENKINIRILFCESTYKKEVFSDSLPKMKFLGYEYCPIPLDEQIITDLDCFELFKMHKSKLNKFGLFNTFDDVLLFKKAYDEFVVNEIIGDGLECSYIFKVYEVNVKSKKL